MKYYKDITLEDLPYDVLYNFVENYISITNMYSLKRTNSVFNELVKDVIAHGKYNKRFLDRQRLLLNEEKRKSENVINLINENMKQNEEDMESLTYKHKLIQKRKNEYVKHKRNIKTLLKTIDLYSFGPPNIKMCIKTGFQKLRHQRQAYSFILNYSYNMTNMTNNIDSVVNYNLEYVLKKMPEKTWLWIAKNNALENLEHADKHLKSLGWIKFFPLMKEVEIAFVYINPNEPHLNNLNRNKFYDCPICKSPYHTMYSCRDAWCNCCHSNGHITNMCPKKYFKKK